MNVQDGFRYGYVCESGGRQPPLHHLFFRLRQALHRLRKWTRLLQALHCSLGRQHGQSTKQKMPGLSWRDAPSQGLEPAVAAHRFESASRLHQGQEDEHGQRKLLRTHTSNVQIRMMERQKPPIRAIMPGRVYRNEAISARAHCFFHQVEGLYIDKNVSFKNLKDTLYHLT